MQSDIEDVSKLFRNPMSNQTFFSMSFHCSTIKLAHYMRGHLAFRACQLARMDDLVTRCYRAPLVCRVKRGACVQILHTTVVSGHFAF